MGGKDCINAEVCIRKGGCKVTDPDCYKTKTTWITCCIDADGDGTYHVADVQVDWYVCYYLDGNVPGKTTEFAVATGKFKVRKGKNGKTIKCFP
jgi:hypothetical protein